MKRPENKIDKVNYLKSTVRLNSLNNGLFDFSFSPVCRLPQKRRDSLVDRNFSGTVYVKYQA